MHPTRKQLAAIVGVGVLSVGLIIGGGAAANAATVSVQRAFSHHSVEEPEQTTPTGTPSAEPGDDDSVVHEVEPGDDDALVHPTPVTPSATPAATPAPEPGDDDAPGTADHHGGKTDTDDNGVDGAGHGSDSGSGHAPGSDGNGNGSVDNGDDHGSGNGSDD